MQSAKDFALQRFAKDLVESVDNLDRALQNVPTEKLTPENPDLVTLHDGLKMTDKILMATLKKHGLERFDPSAELERFDPNVHEAVFQTPMPDKEDGVCFFTQQKGFLLNGRVLRVCSYSLSFLLVLANLVPSPGRQGWCCEELVNVPRPRTTM